MRTGVKVAIGLGVFACVACGALFWGLVSLCGQLDEMDERMNLERYSGWEPERTH